MTGIGTDIVRIERLEKSLQRFGERLCRRILSPAEQEAAPAGQALVTFLAGRWAAKEACAKALGTGFDKGLGPADISVLRAANGAPYIVLSGPALALWERLGKGRIHVSISHDAGIALAFVVIE